MADKECCPRFDPKPWDGKTFEWKDKLFVKDKVFTMFYIPVNFGGVITRLNAKVDKAGAKVPDNMCLSYDKSRWSMDLHLAVDKKVPDAQNVTISGKFLAKAYEGPYKDTGRWCKDFAAYAKSRKVEIEKQYTWFTTCPKCAKKYGKNYVVIFGKVQEKKK